MLAYHNGIRDLFDDVLNNNPNKTIFDVVLYNSQAIDYTFKENSTKENDYSTQIRRQVPTVITSIIGNYINIPNISVTDNTVSLEFDLYLGNYLDLEPSKQEEFKSCDFNNTIIAIENLKKELLAKYHPLGDKQLRFGGEDSNLSVTYTNSINSEYIYIKFTPTNDFEENILGNATKNDILKKNATNIIFDLTSTNISLQYTVGEEMELLYYLDGLTWKLKDLSNGTIYTAGEEDSTKYNFETLTSGAITGLNAIINTVVIDDVSQTTYDKTKDYKLVLNDFTSKEELERNKGELDISTINKINNCILWGSAGNAIFSFETLVPIGNMEKIEGVPYQRFALSIDALVSDDVLYGNNFEYYLTVKKPDNTTYEQQIYPVDRQHTYSGQEDTAHKINAKYGTSILMENGKDFTHSFFYNGNYHLTKLMKQATKNDIEQNEIFELRVQYPFFSETYSVIVDTGGTSPNLNQLSTLTVTYKQADTNLS